MANQYEKSGPPKTPEQNDQQQITELLRRIEQQQKDIDESRKLIALLERELRKVKNKLDEHASFLNRKK
jgi:polyhydroxyalkanoate synthesis regulator phasin